MPRSKLLIRAFLKGVIPVKLATSLENEGSKVLQEVIDSFKFRYKENVTARRKLLGSGGLDLVESSTPKPWVPKHVAPGSGTSTTVRSAPAMAVAVSPRVPVSVATAAVAKAITPIPKQWQTPRAPITCFNCGQAGHIKPN